MINKIQISQQIKYSDFSTHVILPFLRGIWYMYEHWKLYIITIVGVSCLTGNFIDLVTIVINHWILNSFKWT